MRRLFILLCLLHSTLAVRQYVEIERRPSSAHDFAGNLAFGFGLSATFVSVVIILLFGYVFFRDTIHVHASPSPKIVVAPRYIGSALKFTL